MSKGLTIKDFLFLIKKVGVIYLCLTLGFLVLGLAFLSPLLLDSLKELPTLAQDLPANYEEGDKVFQARALQQLPVGMSEEELVTRLREQGFTIDPEGYQLAPAERIAEFERKELVCITRWTIRWTANNSGEVASINPKYGASCL